MNYTYEHPMHAVTADVVCLRGCDTANVEVLLIWRAREPFAGRWALPGGFVEPGEPTAAAALRELREETGVELPTVAALAGVFDAPGRDPRGPVISVAYLAEAEPGQRARAGDDAADAVWFHVDDLPLLAFDHAQIIEAAMRRARVLMIHLP